MIKNIHIKNFKSIENESVDLDRFSIIVGNNGVGKSNLITAISLTKDLVASLNVNDAVKKFTKTPGEAFYRNSSSDTFDIKITLVNGDENEYVYEFRVSAQKKADNNLELVVVYEKLTASDPTGESREVFIRNNSELLNSESKAIPLLISDYQTAISQYKNPDAQKVRSILGKTYVPVIDLSVLVEKVEDLIYRITKVPEKYEKFMVMTKKLLPSLNSFEHIVAPANTTQLAGIDEYVVLFTEKNMRGRLSFKAISHGDLRTLYYLAAGVISDDYSTFVFDEIENGIHPERILKIINFVDNISRTTNKQFVFSTHSTAIINKVRPQDVIYVGKDPIKGSRFTGLKDSEQISQVTKVLAEGGDLSEYLQARYSK
ncbi:MAG: hypothetical protein JWL87_441 [Candidatus Adlerbacteria bacterium]|nr:hypothetical protein [Candidatus Adlerbacteria bacterium]